MDKSIIGSTRLVNKSSGTVDYVKEGRLIFRTHPFERSRLVFQLGSSDPELAVKAALTVQEDVAAFDLNCGCPKRFSIQAGMGAALLKKPDVLVGILTKLLEETQRPVSAKIRLFLATKDSQFTFKESRELVDRIVRSGVSALAIHCRDPAERSDKHPAHWNLFRDLASTVKESNEALYGDDKSQYAALILNGDVGLKENCTYEPDSTLLQILKESYSTSVMSARAAQWNPLCFQKIKNSCFTKDSGDTEITTVDNATRTPYSLDPNYLDILNLNDFDCLLTASKKYLIFAQSTNNPFNNSKYALLQIWNNASQSLPMSNSSSASASAESSVLVNRKIGREIAVKVQQTRRSEEFSEIFNVPWIEVKDDSTFDEAVDE